MSHVVRMSLNMSPELNGILEKMSKEAHATKTDILKKAIFLMNIAMDSKKKGNAVAVVNQEGYQVSEILGI